MSQIAAPTRVDITDAPVSGSFEHSHLDLPTPASPAITYDKLGRPHGEGGKLLPASVAPKKDGGPEAGETKLFPAQAPQPAHPKIVRKVKQAKHAAQPEHASLTRARKEVHQQAVETTRTIMQMLITGVKMGFSLGEEAQPAPELRERMENPTIRIIERWNPERVEMVAKYADPLQLGTALAEWGAQILRILGERQALQQENAESRKVGSKPADSVRGHTPPPPPAPGALEEPSTEPALPEEDPDVLPGTKVDRIVTPAEINSQIEGAH
jgi:hypothetical protein